MIFTSERFRLRPYTADDVDALATVANDRAISRWMSHRFPYPYDRPDAEFWIGRMLAEDPIGNWAVEVDGRLAGGVGFEPHRGEHAGVAEFGYWLAPAYWGRGIMSEAATLIADFALRKRNLRRLEAHVFAANVASARVLEKTGFVREAIHAQSYVDRDGTVCDAWLYARLVIPSGGAKAP